MPSVEYMDQNLNKTLHWKFIITYLNKIINNRPIVFKAGQCDMLKISLQEASNTHLLI